MTHQLKLVIREILFNRYPKFISTYVSVYVDLVNSFIFGFGFLNAWLFGCFPQPLQFVHIYKVLFTFT